LWQRLRTDPAFADEQRGRARARAAQFQWQTCAAQTAAIYEEVTA
jgi:glycosyltransferase involved in cell wall biosynthesis